MAHQVYTIAQILKDLNEGTSTSPWKVVDDLYSIPTAKVNPTSLTIDPAGAAIALKIFLNQETGESRLYLAKWLDDAEASKLQ